MKLSFAFLLFPLSFCLSCSLLSEKKIYVSMSGNDLNPGTKSQPLSSLEATQQAVREYRVGKPQKDIRVIIGEGTWYLDQPLSFTAADGGSDQSSVVWEGQGEGKTIISGGKVITGFRDAGYGIWWTQVDTSLYFEQLYVNGQRATRARTPDATDPMPRIYLDKSTWVYQPDSTVKNITVSVRDQGLFESLMPSGEFEMVVFKDWTISRFRASSLNDIPAEIYLKPPFALFDGPYNSIFAGSANRYSCYLEGDPVFISQENGHWNGRPAVCTTSPCPDKHFLRPW